MAKLPHSGGPFPLTPNYRLTAKVRDEIRDVTRELIRKVGTAEIGAETPAGAQAKVDEAENQLRAELGIVKADGREYTDDEVAAAKTWADGRFASRSAGTGSRWYTQSNYADHLAVPNPVPGDQFLYSLSTGDIYSFVDGAWVHSGVFRGAKGDPGDDGVASRWYTVADYPTHTSVPAPAEGDQFLDTATGDVWSYSSGAWALSGDLLTDPSKYLGVDEVTGDPYLDPDGTRIPLATTAALTAGLATKSDVGHSHELSDVETTGAPDATTFLRGDGAWAVVDTAGTLAAAKTYTDEQLEARKVEVVQPLPFGVSGTFRKADHPGLVAVQAYLIGGGSAPAAGSVKYGKGGQIVLTDWIPVADLPADITVTVGAGAAPGDGGAGGASSFGALATASGGSSGRQTIFHAVEATVGTPGEAAGGGGNGLTTGSGGGGGGSDTAGGTGGSFDWLREVITFWGPSSGGAGGAFATAPGGGGITGGGGGGDTGARASSSRRGGSGFAFANTAASNGSINAGGGGGEYGAGGGGHNSNYSYKSGGGGAGLVVLKLRSALT